MIKRWQRWRQFRAKRRVELQEAIQVYTWAVNTELRIRSNTPNPYDNNKRPMYVTISPRTLWWLHNHNSVGSLGDYHTLGSFQGEFEVYFAPTYTHGAYDE